ncbi:MAG: VIT1/CCC1 transporter family protein [Candidatus Dormibacteraeota bacterium]|nr:VIT1/CCC1 transporter family protein [Candidatus Dormibacteraeota bacterium]
MKEMKPMVASSEAQAAVDRLLEAWRGEVQAGLVYQLLAEREKDPRRAGVIKAMAEAEAKHRSRIEERLRELGGPVPDTGTVRISPWLKLQARLAPLPRMLARMEAAEEEEITDRYKRPTGDAATDVLLSSIRHEEQQHSRQLKGMQAGGGGRAGEMVSGPQARLDRILGRERWHRTGSGWISGAIYGANDGLAAVFGIVSGVSGATGGSSLVLTAGLAGAIASGLSMATGAFLAERSEAEVSAANVARERQEIEEDPEEEREELSLYYQLKGLDKETAGMLAEKLSQDPDAMLKVLAAEELGGASEGGGHPVQAATAAGVSTFLGAMVPVLPFFFLHGTQGVLVAAVVSLVAHFLVGAAKSLFTLRTWWAAGLEMTLAGVLVGGATYAAGLLYVAR